MSGHIVILRTVEEVLSFLKEEPLKYVATDMESLQSQYIKKLEFPLAPFLSYKCFHYSNTSFSVGFVD